jgi:hypothetical protein
LTLFARLLRAWGPARKSCVPERNLCVPERDFCVPERSFCVPERNFCVPERSLCVPEKRRPHAEAQAPFGRQGAEERAQFPNPPLRLRIIRVKSSSSSLMFIRAIRGKFFSSCPYRRYEFAWFVVKFLFICGKFLL